MSCKQTSNFEEKTLNYCFIEVLPGGPKGIHTLVFLAFPAAGATSLVAATYSGSNTASTLSVSGWVLHGSICCLSNGSHGLADWRKAVRLRSLAAVSERQACNQAAERARCADFGSSDLASCQKLLIPRPCPTQCVDLRHTHTCKHSTPTSHAKPRRRRDAKQVQ